jgi:glycerol-3-phosphate cytidylyltransferase
MKIGFTCGVFDLTHAGHYLMFEECKKHCDYLIVGILTDPTIDRPEKNKPIQSIRERDIQVSACKWVDDTKYYDTEAHLYNYLKKNVDGIAVRFLGDDWAYKQYTGHDLPMKVMFCPRGHGYSSSSLRNRVVDGWKPPAGLQVGKI